MPTQLGFDPLLQFVHADDAVAALEAAVLRPVPGPVNVAGEGSISLYQLLRLAGKAAAAGARRPCSRPTLRRRARDSASRELPPEAVPWLRHGLTVDCTRLVEEVGYRPRSTIEAVDDFVDEARGRPRAARAGAAGARRARHGVAGTPAQRERAR